MEKRLKLHFLVRLIPLAEGNFNLVELGPRGTGKSYVVQEISPHAALLTGSPTVAGLFGHMGGKQKGLIQLWDVVAFDEVADRIINRVHKIALKGPTKRKDETLTT
jgi:ATP-dependent Lon protease